MPHECWGYNGTDQHIAMPPDLPNEDLDTVLTGGPGDLDVVALRDDLTAIDLTGDGRAREIAVGGGAGAGSCLPGGTAVGDDVNGTQVLVAEIARGPGRGRGSGRSQRCEDLGLGGPGHAGAGIHEVEDQLALVGSVLLVQREGHEGGDVGASVVGAARDETGGCVEVDGAGLAVVLRCEVWEDGGKGLAPLLHGWAGAGA